MIKKYKKIVKAKLYDLSKWYDKTFFSFGTEQLRSALIKLGLNINDTVFVHSAFDNFRAFQGKPSDVIEILRDLVGNQGIIMMPSMGFSGTALDYANANPIVDLKRVQSRMGLISELFRRYPGVVRSKHPTHPICVWGGEAEAIIADHHQAKTPCGFSSPLQKLLDRDGKILFLGASFATMTFYHTIEEILENRLPVNPFTTEVFDLQVIDTLGNRVNCQTRLYNPISSRKRNLKNLRLTLQELNAWNEYKAGKLCIIMLKARDVLKASENMLANGISCYE